MAVYRMSLEYQPPEGGVDVLSVEAPTLADAEALFDAKVAITAGVSLGKAPRVSYTNTGYVVPAFASAVGFPSTLLVRKAGVDKNIQVNNMLRSLFDTTGKLISTTGLAKAFTDLWYDAKGLGAKGWTLIDGHTND